MIQPNTFTNTRCVSTKCLSDYIILLEGIFLFKPAYQHQFDLAVWIDCSFETALQRAIARGQEGLPAAETKKAFETIYFPAQQIHLTRDHPRETADIVFPNDPP